jgi:hypothetical protein
MTIRNVLLGAAILTSCTAPAAAQISMRPTPPPPVTAESQDWYTSGGPISFDGAVFHPSGPITHFNRNEMVDAGTFERVTLYVRPTQEPGSVVYVPLAGGLMRPYERRRDGDLAGTVGSSAPAFPVSLSPAHDSAGFSILGYVQAPADPLRGGALGIPEHAAVATDASASARPVATSGSAPGPGSVPPRLQSGKQPVGLNGVYISFDGSRWFASGQAKELVPGRFTTTGEYHGFPVYRDSLRPDTIYVQTLAGSPGLVAPYSRR